MGWGGGAKTCARHRNCKKSQMVKDHYHYSCALLSMCIISQCSRPQSSAVAAFSLIVFVTYIPLISEKRNLSVTKKIVPEWGNTDEKNYFTNYNICRDDYTYACLVQILYILHDNLLVPRCFHYKYTLHYETKLGIFSAVNLKKIFTNFLPA